MPIDILIALWPLFALIGLGYWLKHRRLPDERFWPGAERLNYFVLFPALLFSSLSGAPFDDPALPRLVGAVVLALGVCCAGLWWMQRLRRWPAARFGVLLQGTIRFNTYLGLACVGTLFGPVGLSLAGVVLAVMVPLVNVLSVLALSADGRASPARLSLAVIKNPLIMACAGGALFNLAGLSLGAGVDRLFSMLAAASLPLGLLCVGAALAPRALRGESAALGINSLTRLLLVPWAAFAAAMLFGLPPMERAILVLFFALPSAPTAYVLTRELGGDSALMAGIITLQTLLSAATLLLMLSLTGSL